jgi:hypothetical protein
MTQSKKPDVESTINISELGLENIMEDDTITINLDNTYGTTTSYWAGDSITTATDSTFSIDTNTTDTIDISWVYNNTNIDPERIERMCEHYPGLEKVWRNFKSVYDMCNQDYKGKLKEQGLDDDIPF